MIRPGIAAALTVALVGCGSATDDGAEAVDTQTTHSPSSSPEPTSDVKPASGRTLSVPGFAITLPRGWADISADAPEGVLLSGVDVGADENPAMLIVRRVDRDLSGPAQAEASSSDSLEGDDADHVRALERLEVSGERAVHVRGVRSGGGVQVMLDQFTLLAESETWVITFSTNRWQVDKDRQRMIDSVLATVSLGS